MFLVIRMMDTPMKNDVITKPDKLSIDYLYTVLSMESGQKIRSFKIDNIIETNTSLVVRFTIDFIESNEHEYSKKYFMKMGKNNHGENAYSSLCSNEVKFYKFIRENSNYDLPIVKCYYSNEGNDHKSFNIILDNISNGYQGIKNIDLTNSDIWISAATCIGEFQSRFWNLATSNNDQLKYSTENEVEENIRNCISRFKIFKDYVGSRFNSEEYHIYEHAVSEFIKLEKESYNRLENHNNVSIRHGDSHIYNFMFSTNRHTLPKLMDFQFWGPGIGVEDIAHLSRVNFSIGKTEDVHKQIVNAYHNTLLQNGVKNYTWSECWDDYRKQVISMLLIPMWQYTEFKLEYDKWSEDIQSLTNNYRVNRCSEINS